MTTKIDGLNVYFEVWGQGKDLLMLHGWGLETKIFQPVIEKLAAQFKVTTVDLPGFGQSELPLKPLGLYNYANFVNELIGDLNLNKPIILGHSFGGSIAIKHALLHPNNISKLILVSSSGIRPVSLKKIVGLAISKPGRLLFSLPPFRFFYKEMRKFIYFIFRESDYLLSGKLEKTFLKIIKEDLTVELSKITQPTLIIWGEKDALAPLKHAKIIQQKIADCKLVVLKNAGHFPFLDNPDKFCRIVTDFIAKQDN